MEPSFLDEIKSMTQQHYDRWGENIPYWVIEPEDWPMLVDLVKTALADKIPGPIGFKQFIEAKHGKNHLDKNDKAG